MGSFSDLLDSVGSEIERQAALTTEDFSSIINQVAPGAATDFLSAPISSNLRLGQELAAEKRFNRDVAVEDVRQQLGSSFDPSRPFSSGVVFNADLSRSNLFSEKAKKVKKYFPDAQVVAVPLSDGGASLLARENTQSPFREISRTGVFDPKDAASFAGLAVSEPTVLGILGTLLLPGAGTAAGVAAGVGIQSEVERARGLEDEPRSEVLGVRAPVEGLVAGGADLAMFGGGAALNKAFQRPPIDLAEGAGAAIAATSVIGTEPLAAGQVARSPLIRGMFQQTKGTSPIVEEKLLAQETSLLRQLERQIEEEGFDAMSDESLEALSQLRAREILSRKPREEGPSGGGADFQERLIKFDDDLRNTVSKQYQSAFDVTEDVVFDIEEVVSLAQDMVRGVEMRGLDGEIIHFQRLPESVRSQIEFITQINPKISRVDLGEGEFSDAFNQIKQLRSSFFDLKESADRTIAGPARRIYGALTKAMNEPISGDPRFVSRYRKASSLHAFREDVLEKSFVRMALNTDQPSQLVSKFAKPDQFEALDFFRNTLGESSDAFKILKNNFKSEVQNFENPQAGLARLAAFEKTNAGKKALGLLMAPGEVAAAKAFLHEATEWQRGILKRVLASDETMADRAVKLIRLGKAASRELNDEIRRSGGHNSPLAQSVRAGIYKRVLDSASDKNALGIDVIVPRKASTVLRNLNVKEHFPAAFNEADIAKFEAFNTYAHVIAQSGDVGVGMQAGQVRAALSPVKLLTAPHRGAGAAATLLGNAMTSRLLASSIKMSGASSLPVTTLRSLVVGATTIRNQINRRKGDIAFE